MTKTKSKKMTKSTFAIIIMAVVMVAMLAFGGTYAYFTANTSAKEAEFTTGKVMLTNSGGSFQVTADKVVPGDTIIDQAVSYKNGSDVNTYIAVVLNIEKNDTPVDVADISSVLSLTLNESGWQQCQTSTNVYIAKGTNFAVTPNAKPINFTTGAVKFDVDENYEDGESELGAANTWEGITISISFTAYQVQAKNAETAADTALNVTAEDAANAEQVWTAMKHMLGDVYVGA